MYVVTGKVCVESDQRVELSEAQVLGPRQTRRDERVPERGTVMRRKAETTTSKERDGNNRKLIRL